MASPPRLPPVIVVDDDDAIRESLQAMLETAGYAVRSFATGRAFLDAIDRTSRGCVILDVRLPDLNGLEVQERLKAMGAGLAVIVITGHADVATAVKAMKAGAVDFIEKPYTKDGILDCIARAQAVLGAAQRHGIEASEALARLATLSPRERDVLEQLVIGRPNKVAAHALGISPRTVEIYRKNVMDKMQAKSLSHLVRMAIAAGVDPEPT